ncbi:MAG: B12-binding domain-containing radical SAM protein [Chitinispirillaceae bacterium]|nr:B12-binding domain-containing radical SAM protein [Chitinispirillaceae bacterium]
MDIKRLYLINPHNPLVSLVDSKQNRWNRYTVWKPLGLLVVAALTPAEWEITVFDENVNREDYSRLPKPDLVGITAFTSQADRAYAIASEFRQRSVPVVIGGIHATMCPDEAGQWVDAIVVGEAESVWHEVLEDVVSGPLKPVYNGSRLALDAMPLARHDLLAHGYRFGSIQTTRGCPLACGFCSVSAFNGRLYRRRPVDSVIKEFSLIREKLVLVVDDNFIGTSPVHIARTKELLRAMIDAKIRKKWIAQATINLGDDDELLSLAAKAGCIGVFVGFETTSVEGLEEINKKFNIRKEQDIKNAVLRIHQRGIAIVGSFIIGLDVDKKGVGRTIAATAERYGLDSINVVFLTPLPGTRLWEEMTLKNRVVLNRSLSDWRYFTLTFPVARYNHLSWREMIKEKEGCFQTFYSNTAIARRVINCMVQLRNPLITLFSNLSYRVNTLRLDRRSFKEFDMSPGETTMQGNACRSRAANTGS